MGNKTSIFKGCLCGIIISLIISVSIILFFFIEMTGFLLFLIVFISGLTTILLLNTNKIKPFFMSLLFSAISFFIAEILIAITGIVPIFFKLKFGADAEMWAGDGFGMLIVYMFCLVGFGIGVVVALIATVIRKKYC